MESRAIARSRNVRLLRAGRITVLRSGASYERPTATPTQNRRRRYRRFAPRAAGRHDAQSVLGLPRTQHAAVAGGRSLSGRRIGGLRADPAQPLEPALLRRAGAARFPGVRRATRGI